MREIIRRIAAAAAIALGSAHMIYGLIAFKALTADYLWFAGAGIAMICIGLSNWHRTARLQAAIMMMYLAAMAYVIPLPQAFYGLAIFIALTFSGLARRKG